MRKMFLVSFLFVFVVDNQIIAQKVQNKLYDKVLKNLLSHSVKEIAVSSISDESEYIFVDAREKKEYDVSHIKNAIWCGYSDFNINRVPAELKDKKIIVYCSVGYRSEKIAEKLVQAGYKNVFNLYGGIFEWKNQGRKVYDKDGNETERVHAYSRTWGIWLSNGKKVYD